MDAWPVLVGFLVTVGAFVAHMVVAVRVNIDIYRLRRAGELPDGGLGTRAETQIRMIRGEFDHLEPIASARRQAKRTLLVAIVSPFVGLLLSIAH
jgi:hypothetical protein